MPSKASGFEWFRMVSNGFEWFRMVSNGSNVESKMVRTRLSKLIQLVPYVMVESLEELLAVFWQDHVSGVFPSRDYVFDVYVTSKRKCRIVDFNPWGGPHCSSSSLARISRPPSRRRARGGEAAWVTRMTWSFVWMLRARHVLPAGCSLRHVRQSADGARRTPWSSSGGGSNNR